MWTKPTAALLGCAFLTVAPLAQAQTSLFDAPAANSDTSAPAAAAPARKAKAKPKTAQVKSVAITNASSSVLTGLQVDADGRSVKLDKELGANQSATLRLPGVKSCVVTIMASFDGAPEAEQMEQNICKDRKVRLTNG